MPDSLDSGKDELIDALDRDFRKLYVKEFTTTWNEERMHRRLELEVMSLENTETYVHQAVEDAMVSYQAELLKDYEADIRRAVEKAVTTFVKEFQTVAIPQTGAYANGWNDCRKRVREDLNRLALASTQPQKGK